MTHRGAVQPFKPCPNTTPHHETRPLPTSRRPSRLLPTTQSSQERTRQMPPPPPKVSSSSTPSLSLTKWGTPFLCSSPTPQMHTLLLTTPSGRLLAHAARPPRPIAELRSQAAVASSLVTLYASVGFSSRPRLAPPARSPRPPASLAAAAPRLLPTSRTTRSACDEDEDHDEDEERDKDEGRDKKEDARRRAPRRAFDNVVKPAGVTVQLFDGVIAVRRLGCGLLCVCVGPWPTPPRSGTKPGPPRKGARARVQAPTREEVTFRARP